MVAHSQAEHVMALVKDRHGAVRQMFDNLLNAYAAGDQGQIINANDSLRSALQQLQAVVASEHWPQWLKDMAQNAGRYSTRHSNGLATWRAHLNSTIRNAEPLNSETWAFSVREEILFDVDEIVEKAKADHRIGELYDKVIESLESLLKSGHIDSIRASTDLMRLIATLRRAKSGSFSSQIFNWRFARRLVPNIITAYVKRNNLTGPLIEAFEQTASELDVSLDAAKDQIGADILSAAATVLRTDADAMVGTSPLLFLEDHSYGQRIDGSPQDGQ
jgi:hypothetical protein